MVRLCCVASFLALSFLLACGGGEAQSDTVTTGGVGPTGDPSGDPTDGVTTSGGTGAVGTDHALGEPRS